MHKINELKRQIKLNSELECTVEKWEPAYIKVPLVIELLDEYITEINGNEPVEVPEFIADWIKYTRDKLTLLQAVNPNVGVIHRRSEATEWLQTPENQEVFARAWLDGYAVAKEQLYYVQLLPLGYLIKHKLGNNHAFINSYAIEDERLQAKFTETEIKAIDERYWAFAVPVEKVIE